MITDAATRARWSHLRLRQTKHLRDLVADNPSVDKVVAFGQGSIAKRLAFLRDMRRCRFDLWVDLHTPTFNTMTGNRRHFVRNAWLMRLSGARYRRAYAVPQLAGRLTHPLPVPDDARLRAENVVPLSLALAWPRAGRAYPKRLYFSGAARDWARAALPDAATPRIALFFGSRQPAKLWPREHCARLVDLVLERLPKSELVLVGDRTDVELASALRAGLDPARARRVHDFTGRASFGQTAALIARCQAMVSSDSGAMHIGDAVGVPMVALFSAHNYPGIWSPVNGRAIVIHHEIECGPCFLATCPVGNRCMANITPDEVFEALVQRLGA